MNVIVPHNVSDLIKNELEGELGGHFGHKGLSAVYTLTLSPELALDSDIQRLLIKMLSHRALGYRREAAAVLHRIGNPMGILHLTYNSLSIHPILQQAQSKISGWSDIDIIRNCCDLTDECINLLINDLDNPLAFGHCDVLAALPDDKILPKVTSLLGKSPLISVRAAYILAMKGCCDGKEVLQDAVIGGPTGLAIVGLSHIPDDVSVDLFERLLINTSKLDYLSPYAKVVSDETKIRLPLIKSCDPSVAMDVMMHNYLQAIKDRLAAQGVHIPDDFDAQLFLIRSPWYGTSAPDFIAEFLSIDARNQCTLIQRLGMKNVMRLGLQRYCLEPWPDFMFDMYRFGDMSRLKDLYLNGVEITYTEEDYLSAATEWIVKAERYRFGTLNRFLAF